MEDEAIQGEISCAESVRQQAAVASLRVML